MCDDKSHSALVNEMNSIRKDIEQLEHRKKIFKMFKGLTEEERKMNKASVKILNNEIKRLVKRINDIEIKLNS